MFSITKEGFGYTNVTNLGTNGYFSTQIYILVVYSIYVFE